MPFIFRKYLYLFFIILLLINLTGCNGCAETEAKIIEDKLVLADKYILEEDYEKAILAYLEAIDINPKEVRAYTGLARLYRVMDKMEKAIEILEVAIIEISDYPENYSLLAQAYIEQGRTEEALEMVKTALQLDINHYDAFDVLETLFGENWQRLITEGEKMLDSGRDDSIGLMFTFYGLFHTGQYQETIRLYEQLYQMTGSQKAVVLTALAFSRTGDEKKAEELISLIDIDGVQHSGLLKYLVYYFLETGDKERAVELAKRALETVNDSAVFYALLYELTGDEMYSRKTIYEHMEEAFRYMGKSLEELENILGPAEDADAPGWSWVNYLFEGFPGRFGFTIVGRSPSIVDFNKLSSLQIFESIQSMNVNVGMTFLEVENTLGRPDAVESSSNYYNISYEYENNIIAFFAGNDKVVDYIWIRDKSLIIE